MHGYSFGKHTRILLVMLFSLVCSNFALADKLSAVKPFMGYFKGTADDRLQDELVRRSMDVRITPLEDDEGFRVEWGTMITGQDGVNQRKSSDIEFYTTKRKGIFESGMKTNIFGKKIPLNPLKGEPFVWCKIEGNTLIIYSMVVNDAGAPDIQIYSRKLIRQGLELDYRRQIGGEEVRSVHGYLKRLE